MKNGEMVENILGAAAAYAGYKVTDNLLYRNSCISILERNSTLNLGCKLISAYVGLWIGEKVKDKARRVRIEIQKMKDPSRPASDPKFTSEQEKRFADWASASASVE